METMNIAGIKTAIAQKTGKPCTQLVFTRQMDKDDTAKPTEWLSHWDNDNRIRVTMHQGVLDAINKNPQAPVLLYKYEEVPKLAEREAYQRFVIITPQHIEATF